MRITWNAGDSLNPVIASDSSTGLHVVWADTTPGNYEIFYKRSTDGGASWSPRTRLTWNAGWSSIPCIATDSGNGVYVVWKDNMPGTYEIYYKSSTDSGVSWSTTKRLTWNAGLSSSPTIAVDSSNKIHVMWEDYSPGNFEIFYKQSTDGGGTWSAPTRITWNTGWSGEPSITTDSSNKIHAVWNEELFGDFEIVYKSSSNGGTSWSKVKLLTINDGDSHNPVVVADSGTGIHVVWNDDSPGNYEIFYKRSTDSGTFWSVPQRLSWNTGWSSVPSMAIDSANGVYVVWKDDTSGNNEILFRNSTDNGVSWVARERLTWNTGWSSAPALVFDSGGALHLVWNDNTPGNYEIFYKKRN